MRLHAHARRDGKRGHPRAIHLLVFGEMIGEILPPRKQGGNWFSRGEIVMARAPRKEFIDKTAVGIFFRGTASIAACGERFCAGRMRSWAGTSSIARRGSASGWSFPPSRVKVDSCVGPITCTSSAIESRRRSFVDIAAVGSERDDGGLGCIVNRIDNPVITHAIPIVPLGLRRQADAKHRRAPSASRRCGRPRRLSSPCQIPCSRQECSATLPSLRCSRVLPGRPGNHPPLAGDSARGFEFAVWPGDEGTRCSVELTWR